MTQYINKNNPTLILLKIYLIGITGKWLQNTSNLKDSFTLLCNVGRIGQKQFTHL